MQGNIGPPGAAGDPGLSGPSVSIDKVVMLIYVLICVKFSTQSFSIDFLLNLFQCQQTLMQKACVFYIWILRIIIYLNAM